MKLGWIVPWDVNMCTCYLDSGDFNFFYFGGISIGRQLNFHSVSFDVGRAFVSYDTFLVMTYFHRIMLIFFLVVRNMHIKA